MLPVLQRLNSCLVQVFSAGVFDAVFFQPFGVMLRFSAVFDRRGTSLRHHRGGENQAKYGKDNKNFFHMLFYYYRRFIFKTRKFEFGYSLPCSAPPSQSRQFTIIRFWSSL